LKSLHSIPKILNSLNMWSANLMWMKHTVTKNSNDQCT